MVGASSTYTDHYTTGVSGRVMTKMFDDDGSDLFDTIGSLNRPR